MNVGLIIVPTSLAGMRLLTASVASSVAREASLHVLHVAAVVVAAVVPGVASAAGWAFWATASSADNEEVGPAGGWQLWICCGKTAMHMMMVASVNCILDTVFLSNSSALSNTSAP